MIAISGLASPTALRLIDATRDRQLELLEADPANKRAEQAFRERMASISSPKEFVEDFEVYSFVMRAFDLEDQIFGKGLMRKALESDPVEPSSLLNRLTNTNIRELHLALGFTTEDGTQTPDFSGAEFQEAIVARFYNRQFINTNTEQNNTVGTVLEFREKVENLSSWFEVLRDRQLTNFFQVALGLPEQISGLDLDVQKRLFEEKLDLSDLSDPAERERLITRYVAISDALNPQGFSANSTAVNLLQSANFGGQFVPITLNISAVSYSAAQLYR